MFHHRSDQLDKFAVFYPFFPEIGERSFFDMADDGRIHCSVPDYKDILSFFYEGERDLFKERSRPGHKVIYALSLRRCGVIFFGMFEEYIDGEGFVFEIVIYSVGSSEVNFPYSVIQDNGDIAAF